MHPRPARTAALIMLAVLASLLTFVSPAQAAESVPTLKWSPAPTIATNSDSYQVVTDPTGAATLGCTTHNDGSNLVSYDNTGSLLRDIDRTIIIDGVPNCIQTPVVDKTGTVYGVPSGPLSGNWVIGPNLLAYDAGGLKWKYPVYCDNNSASRVAVGADGNIYVAIRGHIIGLKPNLDVGQTQPTKVLDVTIPNDCSSSLQTYKDGFVVHGQLHGHARYYSYAGKFLGQAAIGDVWYEKINAEGKLFIGSHVTTGTYTSGKVSMYDPRTGLVEWSTIASTPGANVNAIQVYPVSGGGVVAKINEQKMTSGIPASPTEYVTTLKVLNLSGIVTKSMELPNFYSKDGVTGTYWPGATYPIAASQGKLVVIRELYLDTGISYPTTVPAIYIGVYDIVDDSWPYQQIMSGDLAKTGGPNGYHLSSSDEQYGVTNNILYLTARCSGNCTTTATKLYALDIGGLSLDYPRGDVLAANTPPQPEPIEYVAGGDSYSSGQGAGKYDEGTTIPTNRCYQGNYAYGRVLNRDPYSAFSLTAFVACGGAVTSDITDTKTYDDVRDAQKWAVTSTTKAVTLTIGGNDIGFEGVITTCADPAKDCDAAFNAAEAMINPSFYDKLQAAYLAILGRNSTVKLYVLGYPPIFALGSSGCLVGNNGGSVPFFGSARIDKALQLLDSLNTAIESIVGAVKTMNNGAYAERIEYISAASSSSPFNGHDVCSGAPYINGLVFPGEIAESFHPNKAGNQEGYASLVKASS